MKTFTILATAALATFAAADVQTFTDTQCMANYALVTTKAGTCYDLADGKYSALGCSVGHNLRVYTDTGCGGTYNEKAPQKCNNLGGKQVKSIKCI